MKLSQRRLARPSLGGLLATRQGSLTVAVLCAACAAGILMFALGRYKSGLKTKPTYTTVLIATGEIPKGTTGNTIAAEKLYKPTPVAIAQATAGAITDASTIAGETVQSTILPGQQLTTADFAAAAGVTGELAPNQRAVAVSIDESHGITDALQPGDHVDIYDDETVGSGSNAKAATFLLASNVLVIKPASATPVKSGGTPVTGSSLILAVPTNLVAPIEYANDNGKLYLALRPTDATPSSSLPVTGATLGNTNSLNGNNGNSNNPGAH